MGIDNRYEKQTLFAHEGTVSCELNVESDLECVFAISGFSLDGDTTASGKLTINKEFLTPKYGSII